MARPIQYPQAFVDEVKKTVPPKLWEEIEPHLEAGSIFTIGSMLQPYASLTNLWGQILAKRENKQKHDFEMSGFFSF